MSLLDVVGKTSAQVIQDHLQVIAEGLLPDFQCGFWRGRWCVDMIFVARQLLKKTRDSLFVMFIDSLRFFAQKCSVVSSCEVLSASNNVEHHSIF